ncbi:MAG: hypothetical protein IKQ40_05955 [Lachnospiraceae bacterium]|nr:hypothetical protein [Lachnospiraceae bacterium]
MFKPKFFLAPAAFFMLSLIITFGWFGVLKWDGASNFIFALLFWVICIVCMVISLVMIRIIDMDFPVKVAIVMLDLLYYITFIGIVCFGVFTIPKMTFILIQMILLFLYLVIALPIMLINVKKEGD